MGLLLDCYLRDSKRESILKLIQGEADTPILSLLKLLLLQLSFTQLLKHVLRFHLCGLKRWIKECSFKEEDYLSCMTAVSHFRPIPVG